MSTGLLGDGYRISLTPSKKRPGGFDLEGFVGDKRVCSGEANTEVHAERLAFMGIVSHFRDALKACEHELAMVRADREYGE